MSRGPTTLLKTWLCRACNLTSFSPCLTGPVDYLFAFCHKGPRFKFPGGYLCETGILLLALSRYMAATDQRLTAWTRSLLLLFAPVVTAPKGPEWLREGRMARSRLPRSQIGRAALWTGREELSHPPLLAVQLYVARGG